MKPATIALLEKANLSLEKARGNNEIGFHDEAGRHAYYAAFHAAQALIVERTGRTVSTHTGLRREFAHLTKNEPADLRALARFLGRAYKLKNAADYETGEAAFVSPAEAAEAIERADILVKAVHDMLSRQAPPQP